jgi:hypothetical protein
MNQAGPGDKEPKEGGGSRLPAILVVGAVLLLAGGFIFYSLQRPEPPTFAPSALDEAPAGEDLVGPRTFTVDASAPDRWTFFSFSRGTVVESPGPLDWDLAFRRFRIIVNGGEGFRGIGGVRNLGETELEGVSVLPEGGYEGTRARSDSVSLVLERWYDYSFFSHLLSPRRDVYAVRTADGRYALMELVGYYCPGALPGCLTFRYLYQGAGGRAMSGDRNPEVGAAVGEDGARADGGPASPESNRMETDP